VAGTIVLTLAGLTGGGWWAIDAGYGDRAVVAADEAMESATHTLGLTVRDVTVSGRKRTPVADLLAAVGLRRDDSLMSFDPEKARQRIEELSWVETASVRRMIPDRVHIDLVERKPFARWQSGGRTFVIDRDGAVVSDRAAGAFAKLPKVVGKGAAGRAAQILGIINSEPALAKRVRSATLVRKRRWNVGMDNGVEIRLPERDPLAAWRQFAALETNYRILVRDLVIVDLRVADRLIVRLTPEAARLRREPGRDT
jgi:cell division protein FtsQ